MDQTLMATKPQVPVRSDGERCKSGLEPIKTYSVKPSQIIAVGDEPQKPVRCLLDPVNNRVLETVIRRKMFDQKVLRRLACVEREHRANEDQKPQSRVEQTYDLLAWLMIGRQKKECILPPFAQQASTSFRCLIEYPLDKESISGRVGR